MAGLGVVAGVHPDRVVTGAATKRGLVLTGTVRRAARRALAGILTFSCPGRSLRASSPSAQDRSAASSQLQRSAPPVFWPV
jgi:hypothetical protein